MFKFCLSLSLLFSLTSLNGAALNHQTKKKFLEHFLSKAGEEIYKLDDLEIEAIQDRAAEIRAPLGSLPTDMMIVAPEPAFLNSNPAYLSFEVSFFRTMGAATQQEHQIITRMTSLCQAQNKAKIALAELNLKIDDHKKARRIARNGDTEARSARLAKLHATHGLTRQEIMARKDTIETKSDC